MSDPHELLENLALKIRILFPSGNGPEVRVLPEGQMLIDKKMVPNPKVGKRKAATLVPAPDGYEIYLASVRSASSTVPEQRARPRVPLAGHEASLRIELESPSLNGDWEMVSASGTHFKVSARCGPRSVLSEVNRILNAVSVALQEP